MYNVRCMQRTQIYLPEEMLANLKILAQDLNTSVSDLIRKSIDKHLHQAMPDSNDLKDIVGMFDNPNISSDISQKMDQYLFDKDWKKNG